MIKGVIAPNLTFFKKDGSIDFEKCAMHMNWMLEKGVNGLFVTGTYGSGYLMSEEERIEIYRLAKEISANHRGSFVIAHVGCPSTSSSIALTKAAQDIGIQAVSAIAPFNYKYTDKEILGFYEALVNSANIPVFAYNNPEVTGVPISYKMVKELEKFGIQGIKDSAINIELATCISNSNLLNNKRFQYITGTTTGWLGFRKLNIDTMIAGMCNYIPELVVDLYRYSFTNETKALKIYQIIYDLGTKIKSGNSLSSSHIALYSRGFDAGCMRKPLVVDYDDTEKINLVGNHIKNALDIAAILKSNS